MPSYSEDRKWSDRYIPRIKQIVGPLLLQESSYEVDTKQAADLIVITAKNVTIACRVRRPGYDRYRNEFTIRSARDTGTETELSKITNGWGDWMFYAHAQDGAVTDFSCWHLIDLSAWRAAMIRHKLGGSSSLKMGHKSNNGDGTHFAWFDLTTFPPNPPILIASSHPIEKSKFVPVERPVEQLQIANDWASAHQMSLV